MAREKRKKGFSIKFDLSPAGLLGVGVVFFCIFLWMFLLGIWSGQTVLTSGKYEMSETNKTPARIEQVETLKPEKVKEKAVPAPVAKKEKKQEEVKQVKTDKAKPTPEEVEEDPSYFAVQVAAFKDKALAVKAVKSWQGKGYESFSREPEGSDDKFTRVYVGRFDSMDAAKKQAATLEKKEKIKPFIVLVPAE
jgi:cell division septation protein DedD